MIHLVLVSHSATLAKGVYQLAAQMNPNPETIHLAAGIDDPENPIGTDATKIMAAIEAADNPDGILILIDLGSALLSAEMALELLDSDLAKRCKISSAPLVEGTIAAAITAGTGASLEAVAQAAENALVGKQTVLQGGHSPLPKPLASADETIEVTLHHLHGLHARPAAKIVTQMSAFSSQILLEKHGQYADGKNLNQILALNSRAGDTISCHATGDDAAAAIKAFQQLAAENFGETLPSQTKETLAQATVVRTKNIRGEVFRPLKREQMTKTGHIEELKHAIQSHILSLEKISQDVSTCLGKEYGDIFGAQKMLLEDMAEEVLQLVVQDNDIGKSWYEFCRSQAENLEKLDNPYLRARALDIWDLEQEVSTQLQTNPVNLKIPDHSFIYVAEEIFPSQVWRLNHICKRNTPQLEGYCQAVVLSKGSSNSHATILLEALNIPVFIHAGDNILNLVTGENIHLDLTTGKISR